MKYTVIFIGLILFSLAGNAQTAGTTPADPTADDSIHVKVDKEASFPGGSEAWIKFIGGLQSPL